MHKLLIMKAQNPYTEQSTEELITRIGEKARNIFLSRQPLCTEAVLSVLNRGLAGDLPDDLAVRLASGLPEGLGSGCLCGALNGGSLAMGLFLGRNGPGIGNRKRITASNQLLHNQFRSRFKSTCCRILTRKFGEGSKAQFDHCTELTGVAAETAARLILDERPELVAQADWNYLEQRDSMLAGRLKQVAGMIKS
jgi:C_GCAxxG_C_C family probable redox protein